MNSRFLLFPFMLTVALLACNSGPEAPRGFSLPEGDVAKGEAVFRKYQCLGCHSLEGFEDPDITKEFSRPVMLGGDSSRVKTYAELVTSVINPSHKLVPRAIKLESVVNEDGTSKMRVYNDVMTISELIDLVAFLQPKYQVKPMQYTHYNIYHIP
ncbi:cytochrome C [Aliiglaciecola litoralis]|uniref:Cytochrome c domain-containing protein n=1 Tax=Aliiglaciecola litoralis TaxID=582857 RepID=A0ABP3X1A1_9ALTE